MELTLETPLRSLKLRMDAGCKPPAAQAAGGHTGIVPAVHVAPPPGAPELTLSHHRIDAKAGKFYLTGLGRQGDVLDDPVEGAVVLKTPESTGSEDAPMASLKGWAESYMG